MLARRCHAIFIGSIFLQVAATSSAQDRDPGYDYGWEVVLCGDLDGDGHSEIAVSAPHGGGRIFVFSGATGTVMRVITPVGGSPAVAPWEKTYGERIVNIGDYDEDRVPDLGVIRVQRASIEPGSNQVRVVSAHADVVSGATGELLLTRELDLGSPPKGHMGVLADLAGQHGSRGNFRGRASDYPLTRICRVVGNFRGDGQVSSAWLGPKGEVHLDGDERVLAPTLPQLTIGTFLASPGDLDGDGLDDLAVSSTDRSFSRKGPRGQGEAAPGWVAAYSIRTLEKLWDHQGSGELANIGSSVCGAGDVNGDGVPDVLTASESPFAGRLVCLSGVDGSVLVVTPKSYSMRVPEMGFVVAGGEDVDGDGIPDMATCAFSPRCAWSPHQGALVFSGRDGGLIHDLSLGKVRQWWPQGD